MAESTPQLQLADFMDLFTGNIHNYGQHIYNFDGDGKESGKNSTIKNKLLTIEQYKEHLSGKKGLGIIPITKSGQCKFVAVDIDVYDSDLNIYIEAIENNNFPLVPFKSKSGGLHLYLFLKQQASAKAAVELMNKLVVMLGLDLYIKNKLNKIIEIFPKQIKLTGDNVGSWINLPYFDSKRTRQYAIRSGKKLSLDDALSYAKEKRQTLGDVRTFIKDALYADGPPCLQTINLLNIMDKNSGRNNYLFAFGVYLKKKDPEFWEQRLFEINRSIRDPLSKDELEVTIISSLRKKDYTYRCLEVPIVDYCRKAICVKREFGVGKEGGYFSELEYGKLYQIRTSEPYYEWEVKMQGDEEFRMLRFRNEEEIIKQDTFLRLCFRELHILPIKMKQSEWFKIINQALTELEVKKIETEDDTSPMSLFKYMFLDFLLNRQFAQNKEQILNKRVYWDKKARRYYFRSADVVEYIFVFKNFRFLGPGQVHAILHDFGARPTRIKTESGKQIRVYMLAQSDLEKMSVYEAEEFKAEFESGKEDY